MKAQMDTPGSHIRLNKQFPADLQFRPHAHSDRTRSPLHRPPSSRPNSRTKNPGSTTTRIPPGIRYRNCFDEARFLLMQIVFFFLATALVGCGKEPKVPPPEALLLDLNGETVELRVGMDMSEVVRLLGQPEQRFGKSLNYATLALAVVPDAQGRVGALFAGHPEDTTFASRFPGRTLQGIGVGSPPSSVLEAYGTPLGGYSSIGQTQESAQKEYLGLSQGTNAQAALPAALDPAAHTLQYPARGVEFIIRDGRVIHLVVRQPRADAQKPL